MLCAAAQPTHTLFPRLEEMDESLLIALSELPDYDEAQAAGRKRKAKAAPRAKATALGVASGGVRKGSSTRQQQRPAAASSSLTTFTEFTTKVKAARVSRNRECARKSALKIKGTIDELEERNATLCKRRAALRSEIARIRRQLDGSAGRPHSGFV